MAQGSSFGKFTRMAKHFLGTGKSTSHAIADSSQHLEAKDAVETQDESKNLSSLFKTEPDRLSSTLINAVAPQAIVASSSDNVNRTVVTTASDEPYTPEPKVMSDDIGPLDDKSAADPLVQDQNEPEKLWDAEIWTKTLIKQASVQESKAELEQRLYNFLQEVEPAEQQIYNDTRLNILKIMADAEAERDKRFPRRDPNSHRTLVQLFKDGCSSASETAYEYTKILDIMVGQTPEYVGLAYGAVKIILIVEINNQEMKQNVQSYMKKIKTKFDMVDHLTAYEPTKRLVEAITQMYSAFNRFLAMTLEFFRESRLTNIFKALAKPWTKLEPLVTLIEDAYDQIKDILLFHNHILNRLNLDINQTILAKQGQIIESAHRLEALVLKFSGQDDVRKTGALLMQRVKADLDQPTFVVDNEFHDDLEIGSGSKSMRDNTNDLDQLLKGVFPELQEFDEAIAQQQRVIEQIPEMSPHRSRQENILKVDQVMAWVESPTSQLLYIDGSKILRRQDFNASFAVPLLLLGESNCESYLILRHFCGEGPIETNNYRTLIQALLRQLFKQRPNIWKKFKSTLLAEGFASDIYQLWDTLLDCIKEVNAQSTFIVIDSIDYLSAGKNSNGLNEGDIVNQRLNALVKDPRLLIKVLITVSLARDTSPIAEGQSALVAYQNQSAVMAYQSSSPFQPHRKLSLASIQDEFALIPQKLIEIQEKRCRSISFSQLPMLYPLKSAIYTFEEGQLRAFVVAEITGMEMKSEVSYSPLQIRAWSVDHNGKHLVKRYHDFAIPQFFGEKETSTLRFLPAGYLSKESEQRKALIDRGRYYCRLARGEHYLAVSTEKGLNRVVIDQQTRPLDSWLNKDSNEQIHVLSASVFKPLTLLVCPPKVAAYNLEQLIWTTVNIDQLQSIEFPEDAFHNLFLTPQNINFLNALVAPHVVDEDNRKGSVVLLYGPPGVGKTSAVKALAEATKRPLLAIPPGHIGETAREAESNLRDISQMAQNWNAILLFNDIHLFLQPGSSGSDRDKSTLLTTFLRVLAQHNGVVFLTTINVNAVDLLFKSQIRVAVPFGDFERETRQKIWKYLLNDALTIDYGSLEEYIDEYLVDLTMNGLEINHAIKFARQLANSQGERLSIKTLKQSVNMVRDFGDKIERTIESQRADFGLRQR